MQETTKRHSITAILSAVLSALLIAGILWQAGRPLIAKAVAEELQSQVTDIVNNKVAPLNAGLQVLLQGNVRALNDRIRLEEFRKEEAQRFADDQLLWDIDDERALNRLRDELQTQKAALWGMVDAAPKETRH